MDNEVIAVRRLPTRLAADARLTITRMFWAGASRAHRLVDRIAALDQEQASRLLASTLSDFGHLHDGLEEIFLGHFGQVSRRVDVPKGLSNEKKLLIGAYFTLEYSFASAAIFNPSMTPAINQVGLEPGSLRFVMSLRAVGEGHISSIIFRRGVIDAKADVSIEPAGPYHQQPRKMWSLWLGGAQAHPRITEKGVPETFTETVLGPMGNSFTTEQLRRYLYRVQKLDRLRGEDTDSENPEWVGSCDYDIETGPGGDITQLVLFPISQAESRGMEDMRLVRFTDDDGSVRYYGTYTAYDGARIRPQIFEMPEPSVARIRALRGPYARNKGLALFPRKIGGRYIMSGRVDGESLYVLSSDDVLTWDEAAPIESPKAPWEFVQVGNCGSPIETEAGWILLTHGVGPMRRYCIGAMLLDLKDPTKVLGRLDQPLLAPAPDERTGYVPNVVYSCGALVHNRMLVIPYGISDAATGFATVSLDELLAGLV
jgi:predicted GH43/DUF377 family glycosyl hydrolase